MPIGILFWVLMIFWLLSFFALVGWKVFGFIVQDKPQ